jgi:ribosome-binding factor A
MKHKEQLAEHLAHLAAQFISRESNRTSLITVTRAEISDKLSAITIMVSVFPESDEENATIFLKRLAGPFRHYLQENARMMRVPHITFEIDYGEKNRLRLEEIAKTIPAEGAPNPAPTKRSARAKTTKKAR